MDILSAVIKECGGAVALSRKLKSKRRGKRGLTRQAIYLWKRVPLEHVHDIVRLTGGKFTLEQLRPDVYRTAA